MMSADKISELARTRGFFWPASEIYGGIAGFYEFGPLGATLKRKFENYWRDFFGRAEGFQEIETPILMPKEVFIASKHLEKFVDPIVRCKKCNLVYRADHLVQEKLKMKREDVEGLSNEQLTGLIEKNKIRCRCGGELAEVEFFNMMFRTTAGADREVYLRPETAQGHFVAFKRLFEMSGKKLPMGVIQIGRAFRNEISPRQGMIRLREFSQAEAEIFFDPDKIDEHPKFDEVKDCRLNLFPLGSRKTGETIKMKAGEAVKKKILPKLMVYYLVRVQQFFESLGISNEHLRFKEMAPEEKPFYTKYAWDCEILTKAFDWVECVADNYRTDWDLGGHMKVSGQDMAVVSDDKKIVPHVWELSFGIDRPLYCLFEHWYNEDKDRVFLSIPLKLVPREVAVFPLVAKDRLDKKAEKVCELLRKEGFSVEYEEKDSIGRRYYRQDMNGTPFCVTVDYDSLKREDITIRERDSTKQVRVKIKDLAEVLRKLLNQETKFEKVGKSFKS
jgi:glycyl-tRNA synthetase